MAYIQCNKSTETDPAGRSTASGSRTDWTIYEGGMIMRMYPIGDWTYLLVIIGLGIGMAAQYGVKRAYREFSQVATQQGMPASAVVMDLLRQNGNSSVSLARIGGELTDNYNPQNNTLSLSDAVFHS